MIRSDIKMIDEELVVNARDILKRNLVDMNKINIGDMLVLKCFMDASFEHAVENSEFADEMNKSSKALSETLKPMFRSIMSVRKLKGRCENGLH